MGIAPAPFDSSFSERHGYYPGDVEITSRFEASDELRAVIPDIAYESGLRPTSLRSIVCRVLRRREDPNNWSEYPNVDGELRYHLEICEWHEVFDIVESVAAALTRVTREDEPALTYFEAELNKYFRRRGIGWQLVDGRVETRGPEHFEQAVSSARQMLAEGGRTTAANELHQAIADLSRRPQPDVTGAVQHALAALECAARDACGDEKATLGQILARYPDAVPAPLDVGLAKMWGFASEQGRHLREGREPTLDEAELVVHVAAAVCRYLARKAPSTGS